MSLLLRYCSISKVAELAVDPCFSQDKFFYIFYTLFWYPLQFKKTDVIVILKWLHLLKDLTAKTCNTSSNELRMETLVEATLSHIILEYTFHVADIFTSLPSTCLIFLKQCFNIRSALLNFFLDSWKPKQTSNIRKRNMNTSIRLKLINLVISICQSQYNKLHINYQLISKKIIDDFISFCLLLF